MAGRAVRWTYSRQPLFDVPRAGRRALPARALRVPRRGGPERYQRAPQPLPAKEAVARRRRPARRSTWRPTATRAGPASTRSRARSPTSRARRSRAARRSASIPRPGTSGCSGRRTSATWSTGVGDRGRGRRPRRARRRPGVAVEVTLTQVQWNSVRRAEGGGFYTWETERREVPAGEWDGHHRGDAGAAARAARRGRVLRPARDGHATRRAAPRRRASPSTSLGAGYTAWERYDHNRIDLVPEKKTLPARRDGAHHGQVAVGERDRAAHHRARGRAHAPRRSTCARRSRRSPCRSPRTTSRTSSSPCCW